MSFHSDLLHHTFGDLSDEQLPDVAVRALEEGYDSKHLRILASFAGGPANPFEVLSVFEKAKAELGVLPLSRREAACALLDEALSQIVNGAVDPWLGARRAVFELFPVALSEEISASSVADGLFALQDEIDELRQSYHQWDPERTNAELEVILRRGIQSEAADLLARKPWRAA